MGTYFDPLKRGTCRVCERQFRLRKDGMVGHHGAPRVLGVTSWGARPYCDGYGKAPLETVPRPLVEVLADEPVTSTDTWRRYEGTLVR